MDFPLEGMSEKKNKLLQVGAPSLLPAGPPPMMSSPRRSQSLAVHPSRDWLQRHVNSPPVLSGIAAREPQYRPQTGAALLLGEDHLTVKYSG